MIPKWHCLLMLFFKKQYVVLFCVCAIMVLSQSVVSTAHADLTTGESKFISELRALADKGSAEAQYNLGNSYYVGVGVAKNYPESVKWLTKAAEQGFPKAESVLGSMHYNGLGVAKDITEALKWWRKAAEHHNSDAQDQLGFAYLLGDGVPKDNIKAYMWFNIAASHNDKHAIKDRDTVAKYMGADQIAEAQRMQAEWVQSHP